MIKQALKNDNEPPAIFEVRKLLMTLKGRVKQQNITLKGAPTEMRMEMMMLTWILGSIQ
jgi:hypothetical protein